ncbi:COG4315 family predicted lipoprotein [Streptomyces sp. NPDC002676]
MASGIASALLLAPCGVVGGMGMVSTSMLMAKRMSGMGAVVTDAKGWTLYGYDEAPMSMCTGSCAHTWMPVMADGTPKVMGLKAKVGAITRDDGMKQVVLIREQLRLGQR